MIDRSSEPDRSGLFPRAVPPDSSGAAASDPRHPASRPTIDSPAADRSRESANHFHPTGDDEANGLVRTLRELIESLPRHPVESARGTIESTPDAIIEPAMPTIDDQSSVERRVEAGDSVGEG